MQDFGVLCPDPCLNTWEFYYPPVSYTGGFWTQGDPTVQTAHCALSELQLSPPPLPQTRHQKSHAERYRPSATDK